MPKWKLRKDTRQGDFAHGITFWMMEQYEKPEDGESTVRNKKIVLNGRPGLKLALDQREYGDQLIAEIVANGEESPPFVADILGRSAEEKWVGKVQKRKAAKYERVQVYLGNLDADLAIMLREVADIIDDRLKTRAG